MEEEVKDEFIGFRITREDMEKVQQKAHMSGQKIADWCRSAVLSEAQKDVGMTASHRAIYEQVGVIRHLFGRYLREVLPPEVYEGLRREVELHQAEIADRLLKNHISNKEK
jgi:hypothetical protein